MKNRSFIIVGLLAVVVAGVIAVSIPEATAPVMVDELVATSEQTNAMDALPETAVVTESVSYFPEAVGFYARPEAPGVYPGVIMIHENRGLRPEIKAAAEELAALGYHVLAVDLYKGTVMETQEEARAYSSQFDQVVGVQNMQAAADFLRAAGATKLASLGWCFGGAQSLALATSGEALDATVIYYGRLTTDAAALANLTAPVLGIFGDQDQVVPVDSVTAFEAAVAAQNIPIEVHMYEGVGHAFANPSNPNFAPEETKDAWSKTLAFLSDTLK